MKAKATLLMLAIVSVLGTACHKKPAAVAPPVPVAQQPPAPARTPAPAEQRPRTRAANPPAAITPPPTAPPAEPAPRLGQMLSPDEQRRYNESIDRDLRSAGITLAAASSRNMTPAKSDLVRQVESFVRQAQELRKTDLVAAKGLSQKASVLARELADTR